MIKFISYTGKYPNLCSGVLTVEIDGKKVSFGHESKDYNVLLGSYNDDNYDRFWYSGGSCGFDNTGNAYKDEDEWQININKLAKEFQPIANELIKCMNSNVPFGCCGGCL